MDWRRDRTARITEFELPGMIKKLVIELVREMGLKMGVIDAKLLENGDVYFLEINPQGQYLFLEAATDFDLTKLCADFLIEQANN